MTSPQDDLLAAAATFAAAKKAYTAQLALTVSKWNAGRALTAADWVNLVTSSYDPLTVASNDLRALIAQTATAQTVALKNLSDTQVEEMRANPQQYFAAGYLAMVNSLLFYPREVGLQIADLVNQDLKTDIGNAWDDQANGGPPPEATPRVSVIYSPDNALDIVNKALADVTPAASS